MLAGKKPWPGPGLVHARGPVKYITKLYATVSAGDAGPGTELLEGTKPASGFQHINLSSLKHLTLQNNSPFDVCIEPKDRRSYVCCHVLAISCAVQELSDVQHARSRS